MPAARILSGHVQRSPDRVGQRARDAYGIVLLKPRNCVGHFLGKYAVNGATIITQPTQRRLHRTHISRLNNQLFGRFEIVTPSPTISRREVCGVHMAALMEQPVLVSLSQWIGGTKNIVDNIVLVGARDGCAQAENQSENYPFHKSEFTTYLSPLEYQAAAGLTVCPSPVSGNPGNRPGPALGRSAFCLPSFGATYKDPAWSASPLGASE